MSLNNKLSVTTSGGTAEERKVLSAFIAKKLQVAGVPTFTDWDTYNLKDADTRIEDKSMPPEFYHQAVIVRTIAPPDDPAFDDIAPRFGTLERFQDRAHQCTDAILEDIRGRSGIGNQLEAIMSDDDVIDNLVDSMTRIIRQGMALTLGESE